MVLLPESPQHPSPSTAGAVNRITTTRTTTTPAARTPETNEQAPRPQRTAPSAHGGGSTARTTAAGSVARAVPQIDRHRFSRWPPTCRPGLRPARSSQTRGVQEHHNRWYCGHDGGEPPTADQGDLVILGFELVEGDAGLFDDAPPTKYRGPVRAPMGQDVSPHRCRSSVHLYLFDDVHTWVLQV